MYQIKCVHCFKSIEEKSVLFRFDDIKKVLEETDYNAESTDDSQIVDDNESVSTGKKTPISGGMGRKPKRNVTSGSKNQTSSSEQTEEHLCLKPFFESGSVEVKNALLWNVYSMVIGDKMYSGLIDLKSVPRFCPFCKKRLIKDAGACTIINVGMIGFQSAGKTVYLTIQDYILLNSDRNRLNTMVGVPGGMLHFKNEFSHLKDAQFENDVIYMASTKFSEERKFPGSTQSVPEPYCLRVEYQKADSPNNLTHCVVCFRDVLGETFTDLNARITEAEKELIKQCLREADAILLFTDPTQFLLEADEIGSNANFNTEYNKMKLIIEDFFSVFDGSVPKPSVCMITKEDLIAEKASKKSGKLKKIDPSSLMIAEAVSMNYQEGIDMCMKLRQLSEDTKSGMEDIVAGSWWSEMLSYRFNQAVYIPVSSIGRKCKVFDSYLVTAKKYEDLETKKAKLIAQLEQVSPPSNSEDAVERQEEAPKKQVYIVTKDDIAGSLEQLNPRFITLPLMYFLEKFDVIPPIYTKKSYSEVIEEVPHRGCLGRFLGRILGIGGEKETIIEFDQDVYDKWVNKHSEG